MNATRIFLTGRILPGQPIDWNIAGLPAQPVDEELEAFVAATNAPATNHIAPPLPLKCAPDGALQRHIERGRRVSEVEDDMLDREFWRNGDW